MLKEFEMVTVQRKQADEGILSSLRGCLKSYGKSDFTPIASP
jgi:hypothetical protein